MTDATLRFSPLHTWARSEPDGAVVIGITAHAQYELGELQYAGLPRVGSAVKQGEPFGELESVKTVSDVYAPCSGSVVAVNTSVVDDPATVNRDPYDAGWLIRVQPADVSELDALLDAATYEAGVATHAH